MNYHFALFKYLILINQALYVHSLSQKWLGEKTRNPPTKRKTAMTTTIARYFSNRETTRLPTLHSQNLFALTKEVRIEHQGEEYRLRLTRNNRLILTK
ncbi:hypothetical protein AAX05_06570 [Moraxella bovoculi]|nr:hypothetical protein AAX05_06570 [Moraxella bovoculi]AKG13758.1 hypothetical protein AAX11_06655 [Moraxella bovoculi]